MNLEKKVPKKLAIIIIISAILFSIIIVTAIGYIIYTQQEKQVMINEKSTDSSIEKVEIDTVRDIFRNFDKEFEKSTEVAVAILLDKEIYKKEINKDDSLKTDYYIDDIERAYAEIEDKIKGDQYNELKQLYKDLLQNQKLRIEDFKKRAENDENLLESNLEIKSDIEIIDRIYAVANVLGIEPIIERWWIESTPSSPTTEDVYKYIQERYSYYDRTYNDGNYSEDKYTNEVFNDAAQHFSIDLEKVKELNSSFRY